MDASVASLVVRAPGLFLRSSNQPISCLNMAWKPTFLRRRVSSSPDLAKAYPWNIQSESIYILYQVDKEMYILNVLIMLQILMQTCKNWEKKLVTATMQNRTHIPLICSLCSFKSRMAKVCKHTDHICNSANNVRT